MQGRHGLLLRLIGAFAIIHVVKAQQGKGFVSLDCGLPTNDSPCIESTTGLSFLSDADFIQSGKSGRIKKSLVTAYIKPYVVLRYFPDGVRNCYNLNVIRNKTYLIRAVFIYGNYDGLNSYPSFDLYIGKWGTVDFEGKVDGTVEEIIHRPRSNILQICLVKTGTTMPFISALELRPLRNGTYITQTGSLKLLFRRYLTNSSSFIRYPDDVFDRNWSPFFSSEWTLETTRANVSNSNDYEPPEAALRTAALPTNDGELTITWTLDNPNDQLHLYLYFAEVIGLESMGSGVLGPLVFMRTFDIVVNGNVTYRSYSPPNTVVETEHVTVNECDEGKCSMQLVENSKSTDPPLVNAIEAFTVVEFPQSGANPDDSIS